MALKCYENAIECTVHMRIKLWLSLVAAELSNNKIFSVNFTDSWIWLKAGLQYFDHAIRLESFVKYISHYKFKSGNIHCCEMCDCDTK